MATKPFTANYVNLELYLKNLAFEPNSVYVLTMDVLGGEMELYFQSQIIERGVKHIPAAEEWTPFSLTFTTGRDISHLSQWGICFVKTAWPCHAYGGTYCTTYIDNVRLKNAVTGRELLSGGDFENEIGSTVYDAHWRPSVLGKTGQALGVSVVTDPLNPGNHCLRFPEVILPLSYPAPLLLQVHCVGKFQNVEKDVRCIEFYGRPEPRILLVEHGVVTVDLGDTTATVPEGSVFVLPANCPYRYTYHAVPDADTTYYWLAVSGSNLLPLLARLHLSVSQPLPLSRIDALTALVEALLQLTPQTETYYYAASGYLQVFFYELERQLTPQPASIAYRDYLHAVAQRLRNHPEITPGNAALAAECGISENYFISLFKREIGTSPHQYRLNALIRKAEKLLSDTSLTVQEVAYQLGMDDPLYFSRLFKSIRKMSPREFRTQAKND